VLRTSAFLHVAEMIYKKVQSQNLPAFPGVKRGNFRHKARKLIIAQVAGPIHREDRAGHALWRFFIQPGEVLEEIEENLRGVKPEMKRKIFRIVKETLRRKKAQIPCSTPKIFPSPRPSAREAAKPGLC